MTPDRIKRKVRYLTDRASQRLSQSVTRVISYAEFRRNFPGEYDIVFYCEQPSHWQNVELVVASLMAERPEMKICLVTTFGQEQYREAEYPMGLQVVFGIPASMLRYLRTKILYTPFTGMVSRLRPKNATVIHTLVSLTSLDGVYSNAVFDNYDYIVCAGPHHSEDFKRWAASNIKLAGRILIPAGYPKLDLMLEEIGHLKSPPAETFTVVYAPTHVYPVNEEFASLRKHGEEIVDALLGAGFHVIFRPHPVSFNDSDKSVVARIVDESSGNASLSIDRSKNYIATYAKANAMVTDLSGTGFTFSLSFLRPAVFFAPNEQAEEGLRGIQFEDRDQIGGVARSIPELIARLNEVRTQDMSDTITEYRNRTVYNVGCSAKYIADAVLAILEDRRGSDWVEL